MSEREELTEIAAGLAAHARRQRAKGLRRVRTAKTEPKTLPAVAALPRGAASPAPRPVAAAAPALFAVDGSAAPSRTAAGRPSPVALEFGGRAEEVRARAQACTDLESLRAGVAACVACELCKTRTQTVFADGDSKARVMFIGEGPGENEDLQGVPFVGRAGQLLTDIIEKGMRLKRSQVYIANVVKCRPPGNRDPSDAEKLVCTPWLDRQIELVDPQVIIPLGRHAANHVLGFSGPRALSMGALRGVVHERNGRKVVPTFHPAYLLRSPGEKKECWKDIQLALNLLGLVPPPR